MKIEYHEWKCAGCGEVARFAGEGIFSPAPRWLTVTIGHCVSTSRGPSFNVIACSIICLEKVTAIIEDAITNSASSIPCNKKIEATICDQCGKVEKIDLLNRQYGYNLTPSEWTWVKTPEGRKDFCCVGCKKENFIHPEESVFSDFDLNHPQQASSLIKIIDSPNLKEAITALGTSLGIKIDSTSIQKV